MLVEPGFFRTELLSPQSTQYAKPSIADNAERAKQTVAAWQGMDGKQGGDPAKLADALVELAALDSRPARTAWPPSSRRLTSSSSRPTRIASSPPASPTTDDA